MRGRQRKFKKGDTVGVIKGKDKGKDGKIERVMVQLDKVLVAGVNQYKRHVKAKAARQRSEIVTITKPLSVSNIALICPKCSKLTRVGFNFVNNKKVRICKKCEEVVG